MNFQKSVLAVAGVLLVVCLVLIGISISNEKYDTDYPPIVADCPDYWVERPGTTPDTNVCYNIKKLGKSSCDISKDFSGSLWVGNEGICNKYKWASSCDLTWDGITNRVDPCNTSSSD